MVITIPAFLCNPSVVKPAGVAAEFGVIMLLYLKQAWTARVAEHLTSEADLLDPSVKAQSSVYDPRR